MQYTARVMHDGSDARVWLDGADGVDTLAARSGLTPHELVPGFPCR